MQQHAISQRDRIIFFKRELALFGRLCLRKILLTKRVCCKQTVGAYVPPRQWAKTLWMTHDCDADGLAVDRSRVVDPSGRQTPGSPVLLAATIHDVTTQFGIHSHRVRDSQGK